MTFSPELWSPHGVEEGKGQGGLATSRQYGNALLAVRYEEEEEDYLDSRYRIWLCGPSWV